MLVASSSWYVQETGLLFSWVGPGRPTARTHMHTHTQQTTGLTFANKQVSCLNKPPHFQGKMPMAHAKLCQGAAGCREKNSAMSCACQVPAKHGPLPPLRALARLVLRKAGKL